jgi:urease accessory protein UreH
MTVDIVLEPSANANVSLVGRLHATFRAAGPSVAARVSHTGALELRGPFADAALPRYLLRNVTCGVFGGDTYDVTLRAEAGAKVAVGPTSATKVHSMPSAGARQSVSLDAAARALLDYDAGTTILQRGSQLDQTVEIVADPSGVVLYREVIALGRIASGERLAFTRYGASLRIASREDHTLYEERCELVPADGSELLDTALGDAAVLGTLVMAGAHLANELPSIDGVYTGMSMLPNGAGSLVRALGDRVEHVQELFEGIRLQVVSRPGEPFTETIPTPDRDFNFVSV